MLQSSPYAQWPALKTALIVPIVHQGEPLGTINLYQPRSSRSQTTSSSCWRLIADRAAMALYNGMLYDRTRSHAFTDSLTGLLNIRYVTEQVEDRWNRRYERICTLNRINGLSATGIAADRCARWRREEDGSPCSAWTWTALSRSTTILATRRATRCLRAVARLRAESAGATLWPATAATSS